MKNYTKEEIIKIIEKEEQAWKNVCEKLCKNYNLTEIEKDRLRKTYEIRTDTLDTLKYRF